MNPTTKLTDGVPAAEIQPTVDLISLKVVGWSKVVGEINPALLLAMLACALAVVVFRRVALGRRGADFEIDEAELGLGDQKVKLRPNYLDRQVAYKIWVELSTRKIGLPIDLKDDVVAEIYDSWFNFFQVTRELIKDVPVSKIKDDSTQKIIQMSADVLNNGLRPHLTKWQARFRRWYEKQLDDPKNLTFHPQEIQEKFPDFDELSKDLVAINKRLSFYRDMMRELVLGKRAATSALRSAKEEDFRAE